MRILKSLVSAVIILTIVGCTKSDPTSEAPKTPPQPKTQLLKDALAVITKTTNGTVALDQLPESIRAFNPKRVVVTYDVLVVYTEEKKGKILNPEGGRSCPAINMFMISPENEPGIFSFNEF